MIMHHAQALNDALIVSHTENKDLRLLERESVTRIRRNNFMKRWLR